MKSLMYNGKKFNDRKIISAINHQTNSENDNTLLLIQAMKYKQNLRKF